MAACRLDINQHRCLIAAEHRIPDGEVPVERSSNKPQTSNGNFAPPVRLIVEPGPRRSLGRSVGRHRRRHWLSVRVRVSTVTAVMAVVSVLHPPN